MNILLVGSGGREHALAWKLAQSRLIAQEGGKLFAAPGNPGVAQHAELVGLDVTDHPQVVAFCGEHRIGLVVIGQSRSGGRDLHLELQTLRRESR